MKIDGTTTTTTTTTATSVNTTANNKPRKSNKKTPEDRNTNTVDVKSVPGYRGNDPVEDLVKYIENINNKQTGKSGGGGGGGNLENKKKERKKDKGHKLKKSNSLEELRSTSKIEMDERVTAATTESNVLMRHKTKSGNQQNTSASNVDINKQCGEHHHQQQQQQQQQRQNNKEKLHLRATTSVDNNSNNKNERRSWGTEELQYLGDLNGQEQAQEHNNNKERRKKDKSFEDEQNDEQEGSITNTIACLNKNDVGEKIQTLVPTNQDKLDKSSVEITIEMDILSISSGNVVPETAEFHVVTKKKKPKKQRNSLNETTLITNNLTNNNNNNCNILNNNNNNNSILVTATATTNTTTITTTNSNAINNRNQTIVSATITNINTTTHNAINVNVKNKQNKNKTIANTTNTNNIIINSGKNLCNNLNKNTNQVTNGNHRARFNLDTFVVGANETNDTLTATTNNAKNLCTKHGRKISTHESEDSGDNNEQHQQQHKNVQNIKQNKQQQQQQASKKSNDITATKEKKDKSRRKSTSSMPASDKTDTSDNDSVHSLPTTNTLKSATTNNSPTIATATTTTTKTQQNKISTPKTHISYADIARTHKTGANLLNEKSQTIETTTATLTTPQTTTQTPTNTVTTTTLQQNNQNITQKIKTKKNIVKIDFPELVATNNNSSNNNNNNHPTNQVITTAVAATQCDLSTLPIIENAFKSSPITYSQRLITTATTATTTLPINNIDDYENNVEEFDEHEHDNTIPLVERYQIQTIKAKSVEHEYNTQDMDQQYPSLEMSAKRHSSGHLTQTQQQQLHVLHATSGVSQFNFAAAAKQNIIGVATTSTVDAGITVARKLTKKEKQQQQQQLLLLQQQQQQQPQPVLKLSTATQTSYLDMETTTTTQTTKLNSTKNVACTNTTANQTNIAAGMRPAVIILNDERMATNDGGEFTFGDFNEDELKLFDEELDEQQSVNYNDDEIEMPDDESVAHSMDLDVNTQNVEYVANVKCCMCAPLPTQLETCNDIEAAIIAAARAAAAKTPQQQQHQQHQHQQHYQQHQPLQHQQQPLVYYDEHVYNDYYMHEPMLVATEQGTVNIYYQPPQNITNKHATYNNDSMIDFIGSAWEEIVNNRLTQVYNERTINE